MNRRFLLLLLCVVVGVIVAVTMMPEDGVSNSGATEPLPAAVNKVADSPKAEVPAKQIASKVDWSRLAEDATSETRFSLSEQDYERFIQTYGESASNLVAVFEQSNDRRWLERALELHPNSPIVLIAAITNSSDATDAVRRDWIERLKQADSNNPIPWIFSARAYFKEGKKAEAIADASSSLEKPAFYIFTSERIAAKRALYESAGMNPMEAELLGTIGLNMSYLSQFTALNKELQSGREVEWPTPEFDKAPQIQYGIGRMLQTPEASRLIIAELTGVAIESKGLSALPPEERERRTAEIDAFKKNTSELVGGVDLLGALQNEELLAQYLRRLRTEGEISATRWLRAEQTKK